MTGFPAARQGDMTAIGGPIVQGSLGVMIGAPTGVACSVCPGGVVVGNPVNPSLGAKVQPGETDIALPASSPFVLSRSYSSYKTDTPAPVGMFGPGWSAPSTPSPTSRSPSFGLPLLRQTIRARRAGTASRSAVAALSE